MAARDSTEDAQYRSHSQPSHTHVSPPKPYPPKGSAVPQAAFPEMRPWLAQAPAPKGTPMDITLPQLQRRVVQAWPEGGGGHGGHGGGRGGDDDRAGRDAKRGGTGAGREGKRGKVAGGGGGGQVQGKGKGTGGGGSGRRKGRAKATAGAGGGGGGGGGGAGTREGQRHVRRRGGGWCRAR